MAAAVTLNFLKYLQGIYRLNLTKSSKVHYAVIQSIYDQFVLVEGDIDLMRLEMSINTATGYWLDCWGDYFSISRKTGETDYHYSRRIIREVIAPKTTRPSIHDAVLNHLQEEYPTEDYGDGDVVIMEPYTELNKLSHKGGLSSTLMLPGNRHMHAVIDIRIPEGITPQLIDMVKAVKAAGVQVIYSVIQLWEVCTGFADAEYDNAYAAYTRWLQTIAYLHAEDGHGLSTKGSGGNTLSQSLKLSGRREVYIDYQAVYEFLCDASAWWANNCESIISPADMFNLLDGVSDENLVLRGTATNWVLLNTATQYVTHGLDTYQLTDTLNTLFHDWETLQNMVEEGIVTQEQAVAYVGVTNVTLYQEMVAALQEYESVYPTYVNHLQSPIEVINGYKALWYVRKHLFDGWEYHNMYGMTVEEYINAIKSDSHFAISEAVIGSGTYQLEVVSMSPDSASIFTQPHPSSPSVSDLLSYYRGNAYKMEQDEDPYERAFALMGDIYQPPIIIYDTPPDPAVNYNAKNWLFSSATLTVADLEAAEARQLFPVTEERYVEHPTIGQLMQLETLQADGVLNTWYNQGVIEVTNVPIT